jgi:uncharacterized delta-60 repeat protein
VDSLAVGEQVTEYIRFAVTDSHGASTEQGLSFVIQGTNDAPIVLGTSDLSGMVQLPGDPEGKLTLDMMTWWYPYGVVPTNDGSLLGFGMFNDPQTGYGTTQVFSFDEAGAADTAFGTGGRVQVPSGVVATTVAADAGGQAILGGYMYMGYGPGQTYVDWVVARYAADGSLDPAFGTNGMVTIDVGGGYDYVYDTLVDSAGRIVVCGTGSVEGQSGFTAMRLDASGAVDATFGVDGKLLTDIPGRAQVVLDGADRLVAWATGVDDAGAPVLRVLRFQPDGSADASFGDGGEVHVAVPGDSYVIDVAVAPDGSLAVAWTTGPADGDQTKAVQVLRLQADGQVDAGWGDGGYALPVRTRMDDFDLTIDAAGRVLLGTTTATQDFQVTRYDLTGAQDASFGTGGRTVIDIGVSSQDWVEKIQVGADGAILVYGGTQRGDADFALVRLDANGMLDTSFGDAAPARPTATGTLVGFDPDAGGTFTWSGSADGTYGALVVDASGQWAYELDLTREATQALSGTYSVTDNFIVTVTDQYGAQGTQELMVTIVGAGAPVGWP